MRRSITFLYLFLAFFFANHLNAQNKTTGKKTLAIMKESSKYTLADASWLVGNWYAPTVNKWTYGFFEHFAIYDSKFWDYDFLSFSGNTGKAVLKNGSKKLSLTFIKKGDSLLSIKLGKLPQQEYRMVAKTLPPYSISDKNSFKNTHFQNVDTAYIVGYLRNAPNRDPFSITYTDVIKNDQETVYGELDDLGRFLIKVPLLNTMQVFLDWRRTSKTGVLEPGEHYFLYYDFSSKQHLIMGDHAQLHNELAAYSPHDAFTESYRDPEKQNAINRMQGIDYLNAQKVIFATANKYSANHLKLNPQLSEKTKYFIKNFNRYAIGFSLMQKRFDLDRRNKARFPPAYITFVKDSLFTDPGSPYTISRDFSTFITDYIDYLVEELPTPSSASYSQVLYQLIETGSIAVSGEERKAAQLIWQVDSINHVDSLQSKQLAKTITEQQQKLVIGLNDLHQEKITEGANESLWSSILQSDTEFYEKNIQNDDIRNSFLAKSVYSYFERTKKAMEHKKFNGYLKKIKSPAFQAKLIDYQNHLLKIPKLDFSYAQSLKNTEHLKASKDADSLFKALISPYKGKVIYLDFWGTWCGPCREEMKHVGPVKEALKDKDVVFMYFANNSPEEVWKTMIKEMDLTGQNIIHYRLPLEQQYLIEQRFSIKSFPTYMLIDKEGNIVSTTAPRPSTPDKLIQKVNELLK